jgi:hypothetical protein
MCSIEFFTARVAGESPDGVSGFNMLSNSAATPTPSKRVYDAVVKYNNASD